MFRVYVSTDNGPLVKVQVTDDINQAIYRSLKEHTTYAEIRHQNSKGMEDIDYRLIGRDLFQNGEHVATAITH